MLARTKTAEVCSSESAAIASCIFLQGAMLAGSSDFLSKNLFETVEIVLCVRGGAFVMRRTFR